MPEKIPRPIIERARPFMDVVKNAAVKQLMPDPRWKRVKSGLAPNLSAARPQGRAVRPYIKYIQKEISMVCPMDMPRCVDSGMTSAGNISMLK